MDSGKQKTIVDNLCIPNGAALSTLLKMSLAIEPKPPLVFFFAMASDAMFDKKRSNLGLEKVCLFSDICSFQFRSSNSTKRESDQKPLCSEDSECFAYRHIKLSEKGLRGGRLRNRSNRCIIVANNYQRCQLRGNCGGLEVIKLITRRVPAR